MWFWSLRDIKNTTSSLATWAVHWLPLEAPYQHSSLSINKIGSPTWVQEVQNFLVKKKMRGNFEVHHLTAFGNLTKTTFRNISTLPPELQYRNNGINQKYFSNFMDDLLPGLSPERYSEIKSKLCPTLSRNIDTFLNIAIQACLDKALCLWVSE